MCLLYGAVKLNETIPKNYEEALKANLELMKELDELMKKYIDLQDEYIEVLNNVLTKARNS